MRPVHHRLRLLQLCLHATFLFTANSRGMHCYFDNPWPQLCEGNFALLSHLILSHRQTDKKPFNRCHWTICYLLCSTKFSQASVKGVKKINKEISNCELWIGFVVTAPDICLSDGSKLRAQKVTRHRSSCQRKQNVSHLMSRSGSFTRLPQNYLWKNKSWFLLYV